MDDGIKYRDFGWWLRLAAIAGVISFAVFFLVSYDGLFRSIRLFSILLRSAVGGLAVACVVATVGHFVSEYSSPRRRR
jgi:hypothetical protein